MKVKVDEKTCVGCGECVDMCPEVFEMDDDVAVTKIEDVPADLHDSCREAAEACPVEAIIVEN
jgi:ferredoxin